MVLSTQKLGHLGLSLFVLVAQTAVTEGKDNVLDRYTKQEFKHPTGQTLHYRWYLPSDLNENETVPILACLIDMRQSMARERHVYNTCAIPQRLLCDTQHMCHSPKDYCATRNTCATPQKTIVRHASQICQSCELSDY